MPKSAKNNSRRPNGTSIEVAGVMGTGAAKIRKKIRDIERLLKKDTLPAHVRNENERAVKALKVELQNTQHNLKAKQNAKKYHMVRFFEKKKAIRKVKQAKKTLEEATATEVRKDIKKARKVVRHSEIDLVYVMLFPKTEKYISLYPNPKEDDKVDLSKNPKAKKGMQMTEERKRELRKQAESLLDEGKLPFSIDDVLQGKTIKLDNAEHAVLTEEIDAPEKKDEGEDDKEDDFFE